MGKFIDLTGERFGRLTVLSPIKKEKYESLRYRCLCDCGKETVVEAGLLRSGSTRSCGCLRREYMSATYFKDITGQKFGRLTVIKRVENRNSKVYYLCRCDCGNEKVVNGANIKNGTVRSCGCLHDEEATKRILSYNTTHSGSKTRLYRIWRGMKQRCYYPQALNYKNYGGRGISVCDEWRDNFSTFYDWAIANGYNDTLTIDRIDVNGNYEPRNCRWATRTEQSHNKTNTKLYTYNGEVATLDIFALKYNIHKDTIKQRIERFGWSINKAIETPLLRQKRQKVAEFEQSKGVKAE